MRCTILAACALGATATASADTILVPMDVPTIQGAIDVANPGDEIVVDDGTFHETIDLLGKAITLRSEFGPTLTTIDGDGTGDAVVRCTSGETLDTLIDGFTIVGGDFQPGRAGGGHGVLVVGSSPFFNDCRIAGNRALVGGGALVDGGAPRFQSCQFTANLAGDGGGLAVRNGANVRLDTCSFDGNVAGGDGDCFDAHPGAGCTSPACTVAVCAVDPFCCDVEWDAGCATTAEDECFASPRGGAIWVDGSTLTLAGFAIGGNHADFENPTVSKGSGTGGGIFAGAGSTVRLRHGRVANNSSSTGGGAYNAGSTMLVASVRFEGNSALGGGGLQSYLGALTMVNCVLVGNFGVFGAGGGASVVDGQGRFANCLVLGNGGAFAGGLDVGAGTTVDNCIVRGNESDQVGPLATVRHSNVEGGFPGPGNIDADPMFVNPGAGGYRLAAGSPCIDAGHVWLVPDDLPDQDDDADFAELVEDDADGAPRIADDPAVADTGCGIDAVVDMGPYERSGVPGGPGRRGDVNADGTVDVADLVELILQWGPCVAACCTADLDVDGAVSVADLVTLILNWGA